MTDTPRASIPAGWYPDPQGSSQRRWWNGSAWTHALEPVAEVSAPAASSAPTPAGQAPTPAGQTPTPAATPAATPQRAIGQLPATVEPAATPVVVPARPVQTPATPYPTRRQLRDQEAAVAARALLLELASPSAVFGAGTDAGTEEEEDKAPERPAIPPLVAPATPASTPVYREGSRAAIRHNLTAQRATPTAAPNAGPATQAFSPRLVQTPPPAPGTTEPAPPGFAVDAPSGGLPGRFAVPDVARMVEESSSDVRTLAPHGDSDSPRDAVFAGLTPRVSTPVAQPAARPSALAVWLLVAVPFVLIAVATAVATAAPSAYTAITAGGLGVVGVVSALLLAMRDSRALASAGQVAPAAWWVLLTPAAYLAVRGTRGDDTPGQRWLPLVAFLLLAAVTAAAFSFTPLVNPFRF
jgi:hypothetical protein